MPKNARSESIKIRNQTIAELKRIYGSGWRELLKEIESIIDTLYLDGDDATQKERLAYADKNGKDDLIDLYVPAVVMANKAAVDQINAGMDAVYDANANDVYQEVLGKTGVSLSIKNASSKNLLSKHTKKSFNAKLNRAHVSREISREINDMIKKGIGTRAIAKRLNDLFYRHRWAAFRTALTEMTRIGALAQLDMLREAKKRGLKAIKIWRHAPIVKDPRDWHQTLHGIAIDVDEKFVTALGNEMDGPGDYNAPAEENCNCHCWLDREISWGD